MLAGCSNVQVKIKMCHSTECQRFISLTRGQTLSNLTDVAKEVYVISPSSKTTLPQHLIIIYLYPSILEEILLFVNDMKQTIPNIVKSPFLKTFTSSLFSSPF